MREEKFLAARAFSAFLEHITARPLYRGKFYPMSNMQISNQSAFSPRTIVRGLLPTLIFAALIPYLIYRVGTQDYHLTAVNALLLAAISPAGRYPSGS